MTHTKEPWKVGHNPCVITSPQEGGISLASAGQAIIVGSGHHYGISRAEAEANAARIVSCVNALANLNPDAVADVVAALERLAERDDSDGDDARTALARIRGKG